MRLPPLPLTEFFDPTCLMGGGAVLRFYFRYLRAMPLRTNLFPRLREFFSRLSLVTSLLIWSSFKFFPTSFFPYSDLFPPFGFLVPWRGSFQHIGCMSDQRGPSSQIRLFLHYRVILPTRTFAHRGFFPFPFTFY